MNIIKDFARNMLLVSPLKHLYYYRYQYNFVPSQICFLCNIISDLKKVEGTVLEIGCAYGSTTVFLNKHMDAEGIEKPYVCIDTFEGFTDDDIAFEVQNRNKIQAMFINGFKFNSKNRFDSTMSFNGINRVKSYKADICKFDLSSLGPIAFCLLDVDLYKPTTHALPRLYQQLAPGGMIVIDDYQADERYDGALEAYTEFCDNNNLKLDIVHNKLGIIRK